MSMRNEQITNENLWTTDFAGAERRNALAKIQRQFKPKAAQQRASSAGHGVWMTDVSGNDKRSVKASLAGRGDMRAVEESNCVTGCNACFPLDRGRKVTHLPARPRKQLCQLVASERKSVNSQL